MEKLLSPTFIHSFPSVFSKSLSLMIHFIYIDSSQQK
jgi:hypothetical protein